MVWPADEEVVVQHKIEKLIHCFAACSVVLIGQHVPRYGTAVSIAFFLRPRRTQHSQVELAHERLMILSRDTFSSPVTVMILLLLPSGAHNVTIRF